MNTSHLPIVAWTVLPVFLVFWAFVSCERRKRDHWPILIAFVVGTFSWLPLLLIEQPVWELMRSFASPLQAGVGSAFLGASIPEEVCKLVMLYICGVWLGGLRSRMDGVLFGAAGALGFALAENVMYAGTGGLFAVFIRAFTAVPFHAFLGALQGFQVGTSQERKSVWPAAVGLLAAIGLHGLYDLWPLMAREVALVNPLGLNHEVWDLKNAGLISVAAMCGCGFLMVRAARVIRPRSPDNPLAALAFRHTDNINLSDLAVVRPSHEDS